MYTFHVLTQELTPEELTVQLIGDFDKRKIKDIKTQFAEVLATSPKRVSLDLRAVSFVEGALLDTIIDFKENLESRGGQFSLIVNQDPVRSAITLAWPESEGLLALKP